MSVDQVLTTHIVFRWDAASKRLLVTDASPSDGGAPRSIAQVEYSTLDEMSRQEASRFIGEFVVLLMPELRARYLAEFGGNSQDVEYEESSPTPEELA